MRILLYEFVTGGGWYSHALQPPDGSLLAEGSAMLCSLAADFSELPGVVVDVLRDARCRGIALPGCTIHEVGSASQEEQLLAELSAVADWTVVIAPEFCGYLHARCQVVEQGGGRLLGPSSRLVALAADKHALAEHLASYQVRVPTGIALGPGEPVPVSFDYPAVLKPRDGAGSQGLEFLDVATEVVRHCASPSRLESFCPGTAASVAMLCGPDQIIALAPCRQILSQDGRFAYLGGEVPISSDLSRRATRLALRAVETLPDPLGYLGVDLILGEDPCGADDVVIEVNPRLTTSYVGLRELAECNLAGAMLAVAAGQWVELCWRLGPIQFEGSGVVRCLS